MVPLTGLDPLLGQRRYYVIVEAAADCGLPLILHTGGALLMPGSPYLRTQFANQFEQLARSRPLLAMAHLVSMVGTGVLARYPDLKFVFPGAGRLLACPQPSAHWTRSTTRTGGTFPGTTTECPPVITASVAVGTQPWPASVSADVVAPVRASFGLGNVVFASGQGGATPDAAAAVRDALGNSAERDGVLGDSARALLRLEARAGQ